MPLLTLGLPTSATAAMMLAGFQQYGLNPGPLLFAERPDLVWGLIASLFIANIMLLVLNLPLVGLWVRLLAIPQPWLYAGILVFATMGTIAAKPSVVELTMLAGFGVMGFLMRRFDYPIAPVVVGLILGPVAESQLRRALQISLGDPMVLVQSPMSATLLGIALLALIAPFALRRAGRLQQGRCWRPGIQRASTKRIYGLCALRFIMDSGPSPRMTNERPRLLKTIMPTSTASFPISSRPSMRPAASRPMCSESCATI